MKTVVAKNMKFLSFKTLPEECEKKLLMRYDYGLQQFQIDKYLYIGHETLELPLVLHTSDKFIVTKLKCSRAIGSNVL